MPADSSSADKYVVYSVDNVNDDASSVVSGRSIAFKDDTDYVDLGGRKLSPGGNFTNLPTSPVPSTTTTDKWGSYWSKRERCCCFFNFLLIVGISVLATLVILINKGVLDLGKQETSPSGSNEKLSSAPVTSAPPPDCLTPKQAPKVCTDFSCSSISSEILSRMNTSADPCLDFYSYACGGYMASTSVSWASYRRRVNPEVVLSKHLDNIAELLMEEEKQTDRRKMSIMKQLFRSCMLHTDTLPTQVKEVVDSLVELASLHSPGVGTDTALTQLLLTVMKQYGVSPLFKVLTRPDGKVAIVNRFSDELVEDLIRTERFDRYRFLRPSDYFYRNEDTDEVLLAYRQYIGDFLAFTMGVNMTVRKDVEFQTMVNDVYHLEVYINRVLYTEDSTNLSEGMSKCERQMTVGDLQYRYNYNVSWSDLLTSILGQSALLNYSLCYVDLNNGISDILTTFSIQSVARYIIYSTLTQSDIFYLLPKNTPSFTQTQWTHDPSAFSWSTSAMESSAGRQIGCVNAISRYVPLTWVTEEEAHQVDKQPIQTLFSNLVTSLEEIINEMYWVPYEQKQHLLKTFSSIRLLTDWDEQSDEDFDLDLLNNVTDNYFQNMVLLIQYRTGRYFSGKPLSIMATSDSSLLNIVDNDIVLPWAVIRPPLYFSSMYPSAFYGSIGSLLSQALSEKFDIDALLTLLTQQKIDHRVALTIAFRIQCLVEEYSQYVLLQADGKEIYKVRGDLTKSENFKDSLALRVVHKTYMSRGQENPLTPLKFSLGLTDDQTFFITYAQTMCEKTSVQGLRQYYVESENMHQTYGKFRVIGTLSNFRKFSDAFQCPVDSPMNPTDKCSLF